jgi:hypothetical protein
MQSSWARVYLALKKYSRRSGHEQEGSEEKDNGSEKEACCEEEGRFG